MHRKATERKNSVRPWKLRAAQIALIIIAAAFIALGASRGEVRVVLNKAVRICMECMGLG